MFPVLRIRDVYPGSWFLSYLGSQISDSGSNNSNKRGAEKKIVVLPFFVATIALIYKELWYFLPKIFSLSSKNMGWGFGIRDPGKKTYPGSRGQKGTESGSATLHFPPIFMGWKCTVTLYARQWSKSVYNTCQSNSESTWTRLPLRGKANKKIQKIPCECYKNAYIVLL